MLSTFVTHGKPNVHASIQSSSKASFGISCTDGRGKGQQNRRVADAQRAYLLQDNVYINSRTTWKIEIGTYESIFARDNTRATAFLFPTTSTKQQVFAAGTFVQEVWLQGGQIYRL